MVFCRWFLMLSLPCSPSALKWSDLQSSVILFHMIVHQQITRTWPGVYSTSLRRLTVLIFGLFEITWIFLHLLHFAWVVDDAKCLLVTCVCMCLSDCMSLASFPHYCMYPDVTWGNGRECPLVVHYWSDLQSVHGFHCSDNIARMRNVSECLYSLYAWLLFCFYLF